MKAALISLGSESSTMVEDALKKHFDHVDHLDLKELEVPIGSKHPTIFYKGQPLSDYDCVYMKGSHRYSSLLRAASTLLYRHAYLPLRPASFTLGHNKVLTHLKLQEQNVPQPVTYVAATADAGKKIIKKITFPIVIKMLAGTHGKGVIFAESPESARSMIDALALMKQPFLMQEYIETAAKDIRAFVVGNKVVASMQRIATSGEKRANIHAGGRAKKIVLDMNTKKVALQAAKACGADICAVDLLPSPRGPLVLEINVSPGLQGITHATKIDVAGKIAEYLHGKAQERRNEGKENIIKELKPTIEQELHTALDFRGNRILLPELSSRSSELTGSEEVVIKTKKGRIEITKLH